MREIKFRAKCIDDCEHKDDWLFGRGFDDDFLNDEGKREVYMNTDNGPRRVDPETVGQYTGLKDRNGKEIYEGDIVKTSLGHTAVVEWENENGRYLAFTATRRIMYVGREPKVEVIGTRFDNPELLGEVRE